MNNALKIMLVLLVSTLAACEPKVNEERFPNYEPSFETYMGNYDIIWNKHFTYHPTASSYEKPIYHEGKVLFADGKPGEVIICRNAKTGDRIWGDNFRVSDWDFHKEFEIVTWTDGTFTHALDLNTGAELWEGRTWHGLQDYRIRIIGNYVYQHETNDNKGEISLFRYHVKTGKRRDLLKVEVDSTEERLDVERPGVAVLDNGDSVLVFAVHRYLWNGATREKTDVFGFNMTKDSLQWVIKEASNTGRRETNIVLTDGKLAMVPFQRQLTAIDATDGSIVWDMPNIEGSFNYMDFFQDEESIYLISTLESYRLRKEDGGILWSAQVENFTDGYSASGNGMLVGDEIWMLAGSDYWIQLVRVNRWTGELLSADGAPSDKNTRHEMQHWRGGFDMSEDSVLFLTTNYDHYAIKLKY